jgi:hypothetical protein
MHMAIVSDLELKEKEIHRQFNGQDVLLERNIECAVFVFAPVLYMNKVTDIYISYYRQTKIFKCLFFST